MRKKLRDTVISTITGFLRMVGAEMPMASDQVVWSEQGRLHIAYDTATSPAAGGAAGSTDNYFTFTGCRWKSSIT